MLDNGSVISVRESISIISNGTTGLYIWQVSKSVDPSMSQLYFNVCVLTVFTLFQAAHVLINWCFKNSDVLRNSTILELGSGVGLCGIAVSLLCNPLRYIFSDCHPAVMNALVENIKINSGIEGSNDDASLELPPLFDRIMWSGKLNDSNIAIAHLPWEDIVEQNLAPALAPNYVIASGL